MAGLRRFKCYRKITRPWTRQSKYKKKAYVKAAPVSQVVRYDMGEPKKKYKFSLDLISRERIQIRHNALESARQVSNRRLELKLGRTGYHFKLRVYPHHVLRENKMLVGAGADRMQTGMQKAFGKPVGLAAQLKKGQKVLTIYVNKDGVETAREALVLANTRLPRKFTIELNEIN